MPSPLGMPEHPLYRHSTASTDGFASIGNTIASPYNSEDESHESLRTLITPQSSPPRVGIVQETRYLPPGKDALIARVQSYEGKLDRDGSYYSDEFDDDNDEDGGMLAFDKPSPGPSPRKEQETRPAARPITVVHFPEPTLISPMRSHEPIRSSPQRPQIQIPSSSPSPRPILHHDSSGHFTIPTLPCSGTPVSPHLALPRSPFAAAQAGFRESVSSISSESIRGFEVMKDKKALFRGGEEELMSPFSPRTTGGRQESGLRPGPRRGGARGVSTVDFWKRFSVSVRLDQVSGKER